MRQGIILFLMVVLVASVVSVTALDRSIDRFEISDIQKSIKFAPALQKSIDTADGELLVDFEKGMVYYQDVESEVFVDELIGPDGQVLEPGVGELSGTEAFVHLPYYDSEGNVTLDVYIEDTFYAANQAALDDFWDKFSPRFEILKERTGWSSQRWFGVPLEIYVYGHSAACYGGNASPTHANVVFSDPMYKTGCNKPYYSTFNGSTSYSNPGELGDWWPYMNTALHEATHSIMPYPIYTRSWLTEGWAEYEMYNTLTEIVPGNSIPDINQATADTYLYKGFAGYQWYPYVANDFHDTTVYNRELQRSHGYDITGYLMTIMRDQESMDWDRFYELMNNNKDTLDRTFSLGPPYIYYTDAFVVNVFGKAMGHTNYWTQTDPMWNYYSTAGHGYGARNLSYSTHPTHPMPYADFAYFAEYNSTMSVSNNNPDVDDFVTITATVYNNGDVNGNNISVRIYVNDVLIHEEYLDINKFQNKNVVTNFTPDAEGNYTVEVRVDEEDVKIEQDETNNDIADVVTASLAPAAPVMLPFNNITVGELGTVRIYPIATDVNDDNLSFEIDNEVFEWNPTYNRFEWTTNHYSSGEYDFTVTVTDGMFWVNESVHVTVTNSCKDFNKKLWCWDCECLTVNAETESNVMLK